ncbi:MAG TPA: signal peptidase II [Myxococcota bacterium]|nr:signal peptidase II [Myxococcota bacterium]
MQHEPPAKIEIAHSKDEHENSAKGFSGFISRHRLAWLICIVILGVGADQVSKRWAQQNLAEPYKITEEIEINGAMAEVEKEVYYPTRVVTVVPNFFNLIYKENPAAAFSLTSSIPTSVRRPFLIGVSILATIFFLIWYVRMKQDDGLLLASFSLILAGAVGNLADRLRLGYVIDFLDIHAGPIGYGHLHWPTFNVADTLIVLGAIGVIIRTLWPYKRS